MNPSADPSREAATPATEDQASVCARGAHAYNADGFCVGCGEPRPPTDPLVWLREHAPEDVALIGDFQSALLAPYRHGATHAAANALCARLRALLESQVSQAAEIARLREALSLITEKRGPYSRDHLTHASNVIDAMAGVATKGVGRRAHR